MILQPLCFHNYTSSVFMHPILPLPLFRFFNQANCFIVQMEWKLLMPTMGSKEASSWLTLSGRLMGPNMGSK